jgi:hypothetical protein
MKKLISIFLLFVLILQYFNKVEIFVCYQLNKDFISSTLCENKSKPELQCDGKCFMKKQLKASDENQNKTPINIKDFQEIIFFCSQSEIILPAQNELSDICFEQFINANYNTPHFSIFQPPKTV